MAHALCCVASATSWTPWTPDRLERAQADSPSSSVRVTGEASALASRKSSDASLTEQLGLDIGSGRLRHAAHEFAAVSLVLVQRDAVVGADLGGPDVSVGDPVVVKSNETRPA